MSFRSLRYRLTKLGLD
ncbi:MAG TPA: hypothetical protein EYQ30_08090 [Gammaproteobacteria bacterium]|nr:hypothetical protein [Gammaproteobacteria bacterium]